MSACATCKGDGIHTVRNVALGTFKVAVCSTCKGSGKGGNRNV